MYNYWKDRTETGLFEPLWSIRLNCQSLTKLEWCTYFHHKSATASAQKTKRETSDAL